MLLPALKVTYLFFYKLDQDDSFWSQKDLFLDLSFKVYHIPYICYIIYHILYIIYLYHISLYIILYWYNISGLRSTSTSAPSSSSDVPKVSVISEESSWESTCGSYPFCSALLYGSYDMFPLIFKNIHPLVSSYTLVNLSSTFGINVCTQYFNFKIGVILGHLTHPTMQRKVQSNIRLTKTACDQYLHWNPKGMVVYQRPNRWRKKQNF